MRPCKKAVMASFAYAGKSVRDFDKLRPLFTLLGADGVGNIPQAPQLMDMMYLPMVYADHVDASRKNFAGNSDKTKIRCFSLERFWDDMMARAPTLATVCAN